MHSLPFLFTEGGKKQLSSKANRSLYERPSNEDLEKFFEDAFPEEAPKTPERPNKKEKETSPVEKMRTEMKKHVTGIIKVAAQNPDFLDDSFWYGLDEKAREPFAGGEIEYKMRMTWRKNPRRP